MLYMYWAHLILTTTILSGTNITVFFLKYGNTLSTDVPKFHGNHTYVLIISFLHIPCEKFQVYTCLHRRTNLYH